jgi:CubicO group peptidase (beta-lactamase class C family)
MTKPVVGMAVQMLVDEGKLALTDRASKYLPSFDNEKSRAITIEQLLTHTAGFPLTLINKPLSAYPDQRAIADQAGEVGPSGKPGNFSYSDSDTETLAAIVARVSGQAADEFIRQRVLKPLGMRDTFCVLGKDAPPRARVSSNHAGSTGLWHKYWDHQAPPFFPYFLGAAGMYSTPADYARFLALWMDRGQVGPRRLLSAAAIERALRPAVPMLWPGREVPYPTGLAGLRTFYGQHWMVYEGGKTRAKGALPVFGHGGSDGTLALAFPQQDLIALFFTQSRDGLGTFRFEELLALLVGLKGPPPRTRLPLDKLERYRGSYQQVQGKRRAYVLLRGNRLQLDLAGGGIVTPLWPDVAGHWAFGESAPGMAIRFDQNAAGEVKTMRLWTANKEVGTFRKVRPAKDWLTVDQLMTFRRQKHGGDRVDALRTLEMKGNVDAGPAQLAITLLAAGTERLIRRIVSKAGTDILVLDGAQAWTQAPGQAVEKLTGLFREQMVRINPLVRIADWRRTTRQVEIVGKDRLGEEEAWVVRTTGQFQPPTTWYVSTTSGLLLKEDAWLTVKGVGTVPHSFRYEDYRDVAGVPIPFRLINETALTGRHVVQFTKATANPEVPTGAFALPAPRK